MTEPDVSNIRLGQCDITYAGAPLGFSKGGVEITIKNDVTEVTVDEFASTPIKSFHKGTRIEVKATLAEYAFAAMAKAIYGGEVITGTGMAPKDAFAIAANQGGTDLVGYTLLLHPTLAQDATKDVTVFLAVVMGDHKLPFKVDGETVYEVTWLAILDESKSDGDFLAEFGKAA